jgi:uncharacterized protein Usg
MPKYSFNCLNCGKSVTIQRYDTVPKFCSHLCHDEYKTTKIDRTLLVSLYVDEHLSMSEIGRRFNVTGKVVKRFLDREGVVTPGRPRMKNPPTRDELFTMYVDQRRSTLDISHEFGVNAVAIQYWLRKYEIPARSIFETHHDHDGAHYPTEKELRVLYPLGYSAGAIGVMFGVHGSSILNLMKKYGIERRAPGRLQKFVTCKDGHIVRSGLELLVDNWFWMHGVLHTVEPKLPFRGRADFLVGDLWVEVWGLSTRYSESSLFKSTLRSYAKRRSEKERLYHEFGLSLLGLEPYDVLHHLDEKLSPRLLY